MMSRREVSEGQEQQQQPAGRRRGAELGERNPENDEPSSQMGSLMRRSSTPGCYMYGCTVKEEQEATASHTHYQPIEAYISPDSISAVLCSHFITS